MRRDTAGPHQQLVDDSVCASFLWAHEIVALGVILDATRALAGVLRQWLGEYPEKILFGTDAFDGGIEQGWEQVAWVASNTARRALGIALTGMMRDGEITRDRAQGLARMVLRENAAAVYGLPK